jgi:hypothetical protein
MSGIALAVFTDGRMTCLNRTMISLEEMTTGIDGPRIIIDDSGSPMYRAFLDEHYGTEGYTIHSHSTRMGFAAAVRTGWDMLKLTDAEWFVHLEDDFTFNEPIDWVSLTLPMVLHHDIAQMGLKRQAWSPEEIEAGGIVEKNPDAFVECDDGQGCVWTEQLLYWSTNPSIFHRDILERFEWPAGSNSEGHFTIKLRDAGYRFGIWGGKFDPPKVTHIGETRRGRGY